MIDTNIYVPYDIAKQLKELGFNEDCYKKIDEKSMKIFYPDPMDESHCAMCGKPANEHVISRYDNKPFFCDKVRSVLQPTWNQVIQWLIEKHQLYVSVGIFKQYDRPIVWWGQIQYINTPIIYVDVYQWKGEDFETNAGAQENAIKHALNTIIKN